MKAYLEIEMPRCCNKCPMLVYEGQGVCACRVLPAIEDGEILKPWKNRRKECPLKAVQEHGRLIDADEFIALMFADPYQDFVHIIGQMPTIIPAEEGE